MALRLGFTFPCFLLLGIFARLDLSSSHGRQNPDVSQCSKCGPGFKDVTLVAKNTIKDPLFSIQVTLNNTRARTLLYMLEEAADSNLQFKFTGTYFSGLGYFIEAINDVFGTFDEDQSYWEILDGDLQQTSVGVSTYEPSDGETVTFNLTTFTGSGH